MRISLIIPTIGRPEDLSECLNSIEREADESLAQVIVVDDASPIPVKLPSKIGGVPLHCLRNDERKGAAYSRNRAMSVVADDVDAVGFIDDDARLCPGWLVTARRELYPHRGAITGPVRRFDSGLVSRARQLRYDKRYASLESGQAVDFLAGGNSLVWRGLFERTGGFPNLKTMSDRFLVRMLEDLGGHCHFVPEMYVLHRNSKGIRVAIRESWRAGKIDDTPQSKPALARLFAGFRGAFASSDKIAALFNVFLEAIFLSGMAVSKNKTRTIGEKSIKAIPSSVPSQTVRRKERVPVDLETPRKEAVTADETDVA